MADLYYALTPVFIGTIVIVLYWPWQHLWTDIARQKIFAERDAIFDLARTGALSFESSEYRGIRVGLESLIRYAHFISWPRMIVVGRYAGNSDAERPSLYELANRIQDPEVRVTVQRHLETAFRTITISIIARSPTLWLPYLFLMLWRRVFGRPRLSHMSHSLNDAISKGANIGGALPV